MKIRVGRYLQYGSKFWDGREQIYVAQGFQVGIFRLRTGKVILELSDAKRVAELIKGEEIIG